MTWRDLHQGDEGRAGEEALRGVTGFSQILSATRFFEFITSIILKSLAIPAGFEPATHGVEIRYSIQLSYGTVLALIALRIRKIRPVAKPRSNPFPQSGD